MSARDHLHRLLATNAFLEKSPYPAVRSFMQPRPKHSDPLSGRGGFGLRKGGFALAQRGHGLEGIAKYITGKGPLADAFRAANPAAPGAAARNAAGD